MKRTAVGSAVRFLLTEPLDWLATSSSVEPQQKTLLLVHLHHIGDYVLVRNFIRIMKGHERYRNYRITLCGNEQIRPLVEDLDADCFADCIWVDRKKLLNNPGYRFSLLRDIRRRGFSLALQPAFSREFYFGDAIVKASNAAERIGSHGGTSEIPLWQKRMSDRSYTKLVPVTPGSKFEFLRNKEFFENLLGQSLCIDRPTIDVRNVTVPIKVDVPYAVVFPGASVPSKRWRPEGFAAVARHVWEHHGLEIVVAGAPSERDLVAQVRDLAQGVGVVDLAGRTTLAQLAKYLAGAEILIANDTVAVHLAAAVGTPVVYLLTGAHYGRFGPYPAEVFDKTKAIYPPGMSMAGESQGALDIKAIATSEVIAAADALLAPGPGNPARPRVSKECPLEQ